MSQRRVRAAVAQLAPVFDDRQATLDKACVAILEAARQGAELLAFPETFIPGYPYFAMALPPTAIGDSMARLYRDAIEIPSQATEQLASAAREAGCTVVMGLHERDGGTLYNAQLVIGPDGEILGKRRKLMPTSHERLVWGRGDGSDLHVFQAPFGTLGALICYEHSNALFRYAVQAQGEQIHVANWPGGMPRINHIIDAAVRHYAFEAQAFVLSATGVHTPESLAALGETVAASFQVGGGYSGILAPRGEYLAGPLLEGEGILHAELDFALIDRLKAVVDSAGHYARPDVVRLVWNAEPARVVEKREGEGEKKAVGG